MCLDYSISSEPVNRHSLFIHPLSFTSSLISKSYSSYFSRICCEYNIFYTIHYYSSWSVFNQIDFDLLCNYPFSLLVSTYCLVWLHACSSLCYPCTDYLWSHFMTFILLTHFTLSLLCFSLCAFTHLDYSLHILFTWLFLFTSFLNFKFLYELTVNHSYVETLWDA